MIATCRVLSPDGARRAGSLYTDSEFDLDPVRDLLPRAIEVGRVCIDPAWRKARIVGAGMEPADEPTPVGPMPKIAGLVATQGDGDGMIDLHWNPVKRGLKSYIVERTSDPAGQTGWGNADVVTKSSAVISGLVSGTRYWFRARAIGSAGPGPWSDAATKVAP